jgi:hypothetical protein
MFIFIIVTISVFFMHNNFSSGSKKDYTMFYYGKQESSWEQVLLGK